MKRLAVLLALAIPLAGCATPAASQSGRALTQIYRGMDRADVIAKLGEPSKVERNGALEVLTFRFRESDASAWSGCYVVIGRDGRVDAWGRDR